MLHLLVPVLLTLKVSLVDLSSQLPLTILLIPQATQMFRMSSPTPTTIVIVRPVLLMLPWMMEVASTAGELVEAGRAK